MGSVALGVFGVLWEFASCFSFAKRAILQSVSTFRTAAADPLGMKSSALIIDTVPPLHGTGNPEAQRRRAFRRRNFYQGLYALHKR
jgi:hypothetical protein